MGIATGNAASVFFKRGTPIARWNMSRESYRMITDAECKAEFKISRDKWMARWRGESDAKSKRV